MAGNNPTGKGGFKEHPQHINRRGRPKTFDEVRKLAQSISHEVAIDPKTRAPIVAGGTTIVDPQTGLSVVVGGHRVTIVEAILRKWAFSNNPALNRAFVEICFGKVPDSIDITSNGQAIGVIGLGIDTDKL